MMQSQDAMRRARSRLLMNASALNSLVTRMGAVAIALVLLGSMAPVHAEALAGAAEADVDVVQHAPGGHEGHGHDHGHDHDHDGPAAAGADAPGAAGAHGEAQGAAHGMGKPALNPGENKTTAVLFWLFALMCVGGSVFVITRRNLISAVMGMVGTFFAIAAIYTMLYAHFLAAIQVLVYAGAIMVLFVFVIMILNKPEDDPWRRGGAFGRSVGVVLVGYLLIRMIQVLWSFSPAPGSSRPPEMIAIPGAEPVMFGSTMAVGQNLFTSYLFPFEAVSLVLLIAIVGAIAVARPHEKPPAAIPADNAPNS